MNDVQSDHCGLLIQRKSCAPRGNNVVRKRAFSKINWGICKNQLYLMGPGNLLSINDPDEDK